MRSKQFTQMVVAIALSAAGGLIGRAQSPFLDYADRKAREAEVQGAYNFGVVFQPVTVSVSGGQKLPLEPGFVLKLVSEAYDKRPDSFVGYIAVKNRIIAFSLPRSAVSVIRKNSSDWKEASERYQQAVDVLETGLKQAQAAADQQSAPASPQLSSTLSKNDRARMLYVLRDEKFISSIRAGEQMPDDQIITLYTKALEQRRLRGIESAIRGLQR